MPVSRSFLKGQLHLFGLTLGITLASHALASDSLPTNHLIVKLRNTPATMAQASAAPSVSAAALDEMSSRIGVKLQAVRRLATGANVLRLPHFMKYADAQAYAQKLQADPSVLYAVPDGRRTPTMIPTDPYWTQQYDLQVSPGGIDMPDAWNYTTGSSGINVAVIDTGILQHPDLQGRILPGYDFVSNPVYANDNQSNPLYPTYGSRDSDPTDPGDWVSQSDINNDPADFSICSVEPSSWHGTHVSGTIAADPNNSIGIAGINWKSSILPVRVLGKCGGYDSDIIDGMLWANGLPVAGAPNNPNPAQVLNLSLGGPGPCYSPYQDAINQIIANNGVVVIAAGNDSGDAMQSAPGNCSNVITVGAVGPSGAVASYSNTGTNVAIMAPGGDGSSGLWSTWNDGTTTAGNMTYGQMMGTSMATPHVSGVTSLLLLLNPALTPDVIRDILQSTARALPTGTSQDCLSTRCGPGMLDANGALAALQTQNGVAVAHTTSSVVVQTGDKVTLHGYGTPSNDGSTDGTISSYAWTQTGGAALSLANANTPNPTFIASSTPGTYAFNLTVTDSYGKTASAPVTVTVLAPPVFTSATSQLGYASRDLSFTVSASDPNNKWITLNYATLPNGASFDASTGTFDWYGYKSPGNYTATFTALSSDGTMSTQTVNITINPDANTTSSSGGGGGGCTINPKAPFDPLLPGLLVGALLVQVRRQRRKNRH